jgi:VIT1/CCC1 family predicted Fe2+/Mn2+ transporter
MTFVAIVLLLPPMAAVIASSLWGLLILGALSWAIAEQTGVSPTTSVVRHLTLAVAVVGGSWFLGRLLSGGGRL